MSRDARAGSFRDYAIVQGGGENANAVVPIVTQHAGADRIELASSGRQDSQAATRDRWLAG